MASKLDRALNQIEKTLIAMNAAERLDAIGFDYDGLARTPVGGRYGINAYLEYIDINLVEGYDIDTTFVDEKDLLDLAKKLQSIIKL